jgi:hypothetical protein
MTIMGDLPLVVAFGSGRPVCWDGLALTVGLFLRQG